ncbi:MAG: hypothetical protein R6V23_14395 [Bacteroidales bacterium]
MKKIKTKLYIGLGIMMLITATLFQISMSLSDRIAKDSENILKNNYATVGYTVEMLNLLDEINNVYLQKIIDIELNNEDYQQLVDSLSTTFNQYLELQQNNITEKGEKNFVNSLTNAYKKFINSIKNPDISSTDVIAMNYQYTKDYLLNIYRLNFDIIEDKNNKAQAEAIRLLNIQKEALLFGFFVFAILFIFLPILILGPIDKLSNKLVSFYKSYFDKEIIIKEDNEIKALAKIFDKVVDEFKKK